jgi:hypothetical protein
MVNLAVHPQFAFLRGDAGFEDLLVRMNVPANLRHPVVSRGPAKTGGHHQTMTPKQ